jgi:hypothetical protein
VDELAERLIVLLNTAFAAIHLIAPALDPTAASVAVPLS